LGHFGPGYLFCQFEMTAIREAGEHMAAVPGNRLEALSGNRKGQHSVRMNDQWRLCFIWREGAVEIGEIVDYH
jgi:proteic killer suppression protein